MIRQAVDADEPAWRRLWAGYLAFYRTTLPDEMTTLTWQRALDPTSPVFARVAEHEGVVAGFAMAVLHAGTWVRTPICYLEDLFVDPGVRGHGLGRALVEDLIGLGTARGWSRLYWNSQTGNPARALYDRLAPVDDVVRYQLSLPGAARPGS